MPPGGLGHVFKPLSRWYAGFDMSRQNLHIKRDADLIRAGKLLAQARRNFESRRAREAVSLAFRACGLAVGSLHRAKGIHLGLADESPTGSEPHDLAAFYQGFARFKRRLDGDRRTLLNVEEAANWIRRSGMFLDSLEKIITHSGKLD